MSLALTKSAVALLAWGSYAWAGVTSGPNSAAAQARPATPTATACGDSARRGTLTASSAPAIGAASMTTTKITTGVKYRTKKRFAATQELPVKTAQYRVQ